MTVDKKVMHGISAHSRFDDTDLDAAQVVCVCVCFRFIDAKSYFEAVA